MRLAVISDTHGNDLALDMVLADIRRRGYDQIVCLGDAIQGGPQPAEVVARLRDLKIPTVMGNSDDWLLTGSEIGSEEVPADRLKRLYDVRDWSLSKLLARDRDFISGFSPTITLELGGENRILCFHGSPRDYEEVLLPDSPLERFRGVLDENQAKYFAGGHVHTQFVRQIGDGFHFNPGSVGVVIKGRAPSTNVRIDPVAEYAFLILDSGVVSLEFHRLPYDVEEMLAIYRASGRPHYGIAAAEFGR